ncbi:hypothetical protein [Promicromonospora sp. NPDC050249]|uniref:hypothetical protein n=1 Tax=Promicromonospora sp. NPDC050249 TaxID=3154743 RepID=UPI0033C0B91D
MRRTSLATSALNVLLRPATAGMRAPDRAFDALVVKAERKTRAHAVAVPEFVDDLRLLLRSFAACPGLSPMGWHEYELSRYGLTAADVGAAFGDYADRYCAA